MPRLLPLAIAALLTACAGAQRPAPSDPLASVSGDELYRRGLAHEAEGDLVRAEQYIAAAVQRGYPDGRAIEPLLRICLGASRYGAALGHAERFLRRHPDDWRMRYLVATLYLAVERERDAERELQRLIDERPTEAEPHLAMARLYDGAGDGRTAARFYRSFLERAGDGYDARLARAWLRRWRGEHRGRRR